jgi:primase-polymerase (primpol)-like protein
MTTGSPDRPVQAMMAGGQKNAPVIDFASRLIDDKGWSNTMSSYPDPGAGVHARRPALRVDTGAPVLLPVEPSAIPAELVRLKAWYPAIIRPKANGKPGLDKIPGDPVTGRPALWRDPSTRCTFSTAYMAYESGRFLGIGFMMHAESGLIGIDIDKCVTADGTIAPWALEIAQSFTGAYWERSISGTGLRGFCRGVMPNGARAKKTTLHGCSVEMYADLRFLVVTGQEVAL